MKSRIGFAIAMLALVSTPALAQQTQTKTAGILLGSGGSIGILWHASENLALRPEMTIAKSHSENTTPISGTATATTTSDTWTTGVGGSVLFYTAKWDNLRAYISPRLLYSHNKSTSSSTSGTATTNTNSSSTYSGSGSVGAQYALGTRFAVYGEVGLAFSWSPTTTSTLSSSTSKGHAIGTRSTIGGVLYF